MAVRQYAYQSDPERAKQRRSKPAAQNTKQVTGQSVHLLQRARVAPGSLTRDEVLQLQSAIGNRAVSRLLAQGKPGKEQPLNRTGLPDQLKEGIEALSGLSLDDVRVHYNSSKAAELDALAYTQGTEIHVASGQERHLPHEAWHVVQQKQGRVSATFHFKGDQINNDESFEKEADKIGAKALQLIQNETNESTLEKKQWNFHLTSANAPIQLKIVLTDPDAAIYEEENKEGENTKYGEMYYTEKNVDDDTPIFVPVGPIDDLEMQLASIPERDYAQAQEFEILSLLHKTELNFISDKGLRSPPEDIKRHMIRRALDHPLFKDPNRTRHGLSHRFAEPNGVMFSRLEREETEKRIGQPLPPSVTFFKVESWDWATEIAKHKSFFTEIAYDYAYGRHAILRDFTPRSQRSKLRHKKVITSDPNDPSFKTDALKGDLPKPTQNISTLWIEYKAHSSGLSRGKGQYKSMGDWNALAYAAYWFHHGHSDLNLQQDWEWLHVQGAQNGGKTDSTNLVAGTSTTNSRMIPWEDKINQWTAKADREHPLSVEYEGDKRPDTLLGTEIRVKIAAEKGLPGIFGPIPKSSAVLLVFKPLDGTVYDKISNAITRSTLVEDAALEHVEISPGKRYQVIRGSYRGFFGTVRHFNNGRVTIMLDPNMREVVVDRWDIKVSEESALGSERVF